MKEKIILFIIYSIIVFYFIFFTNAKAIASFALFGIWLMVYYLFVKEKE